MPPLNTALDEYEVWFVTGSQTLYGEETLRQVAEQSRQVAAGLDGRADPCHLEAGAHRPGRHPPARSGRERPR